MTTKKFAVKKLLLSGFAVATLSLSTGAFASVSATSDNGHGNGHGNGNSHNNGGNNGNGNNNGGGSTPSVGGVTLGVQQRTNVGANHSNGNGQHGGSGYGGTNVDVDNNVWVQIGNVVGGAVNITINFVNNIFS